MLPSGVEQRRGRARVRGAWTPLSRALLAAGDRWTLLIVLALAPGRMRLSQLHRRLPGISTGVLDRYVDNMARLGLLTRTRFKERPPRVELELTERGAELLAVASMLARWGMRNRWSEPQGREHVDIGALLRMLPALLDEDARLREGAIVEAQVEDAADPLYVLYRVQDGRLRLLADTRENAELVATVTISGDTHAWIAALGPDADRSGLRLAGEYDVAADVLDGLPQALATGPAGA